MSLKNKILKYNQIQLEVFEYFGASDSYKGFEDYTYCPSWAIYDGQIMWSETNGDHEYFKEENEFMYGERIVKTFEKEDYTMIIVSSCTGDMYYAIFDNSKKVELEDE